MKKLIILGALLFCGVSANLASVQVLAAPGHWNPGYSNYSQNNYYERSNDFNRREEQMELMRKQVRIQNEMLQIERQANRYRG